MKIRYETTMEHLLAFNRFHYANSPTWRRQRMLLAWIGPVGFFVMFGVYFSRVDPEILRADLFGSVLFPMLGLAFSFTWYYWVRARGLAQITSNVRKLLAEDSNRTLLGWREMELVGHRLIQHSDLIDTSIDLRAIIKIVRNEDYAFIYIASVSAYVIPMNLYPEQEYRTFVAELREAWENRERTRPEESHPPRRPDERIVELPH